MVNRVTDQFITGETLDLSNATAAINEYPFNVTFTASGIGETSITLENRGDILKFVDIIGDILDKYNIKYKINRRMY